MKRHYFTVSIIVAIGLALTACAAPTPLSDQDAAALETLGSVAGPTSNVETDRITSTECWLPSAHMIDDLSIASDTEWRVLCRVHYTDNSGDRYQDTTCIGDFAKNPMLDHCYRWAHYDFAPRFEDHPGVAAG